MSNFNDSKRVKLSSVESGIKPEDDDEASAAQEKQPIAGCSHSAKRKTPKDASVTVTATVTSDTSKGSDLVEDVLMLIFETNFLDTADLLHCRLVNLSWRDCATSVLLRSSACQISFNILWVPIPSTVKFNETKAVYCNNNNYGALLEDLNEIISQSPKFPCSNFRFVNSYSFGDAHHENKIDTSSLQKFFSIYGNNVKTITVGDLILKSDLRSLLLNYSPCLECLDLQYLKSFGNRDPSVYDQPLFPQSVILPNLKTIVLGQCADFNLMELVDSAISLQSIENTVTDDLKLLLDHEKVGLIKKLEYWLHEHDWVELSVFERLAESQLKLTKLIVTSARQTFPESHHVVVFPASFLKVQMFLNRILESSKDTLKYLEFRICPFADIKFPILKNLECLKLMSDPSRSQFDTSPSTNSQILQFNLGDEDQFDARREDENFEYSNEVDARIYGRCPNRPCDSFPNLKKVQLDIKNYAVGRDGSLLLFHTCRSHNRKIVPHAYKTVEVLEIFSKLPQIIRQAKSVSNLFPNVTILKIKCEQVLELNCSLWAISPLAKSIEIYGMCNDYSYYDEDESDGSCSEDESGIIDQASLVDSFFTGFTLEMCKKLKKVKEFPMEIEGNPSLQNFIRVKPSICDLKDLTDFKILFAKLRSPFASHVTGFYAFRNMPRTKITFAHATPIKFNEVECEMEKYLAPISTFVHFTHMNLPKRFEYDNGNWFNLAG